MILKFRYREYDKNNKLYIVFIKPTKRISKIKNNNWVEVKA